MKLGIITYDYTENGLKAVKDKGLEYVEFCINQNADQFLNEVDNIKTAINKISLKIASIGRWGVNRIDKNGIIAEELKITYDLIDACNELGCPIFVCGCNYVNELSYYDNLILAVSYFRKLIEYGKTRNVKIATYNCRWNNFVYSDETWKIIHNHLMDLGIKYDPSHCIYAGGNYLSEIAAWGERIVHFHLKGSLYIDHKRVDDPPAGLDQTDWNAVISLLITKGYKGVLSIEPHSQIWQKELGDKGVNYTIQYFRKYDFEVGE